MNDLLWLVSVSPLVGIILVLIWAWWKAMEEVAEAERERDELFDSIYAVVCRGDEDCIAGYNHDGPHRYPSWDNR